MSDDERFLTNLWDALLSRQEQQICAAFSSLSTTEQAAVRAHLRRMVTEPGWQLEQRRSAQIALNSLHRFFPTT
jgi:hypothetical protein